MKKSNHFADARLHLGKSKLHSDLFITHKIPMCAGDLLQWKFCSCSKIGMTEFFKDTIMSEQMKDVVTETIPNEIGKPQRIFP